MDPSVSPEGMNFAADHRIRAAQVVVPCTDLAASLEFFVGRLGFRVDLIFPADSPVTAVVSGHGVCLRLETRGAAEPLRAPLVLRLLCDRADGLDDLAGPDGVQVARVGAEPDIVVPSGTQEFLLSRNDEVNAWGTGRAGMQYRDLIPGRLGGRFVASHIRIPMGGVVPDYVHFHRIRFQMIFCKAGWVRVVYEDQGPPFVLRAGDCVLQPPAIRHRVLEASEGLEVIEIGCPAIHDTVADHALTLPTSRLQPDRLFSGQRFVRHIDAGAAWQPWRVNGSNATGFEACDVGIAAATAGMAEVNVIRSMGTPGQENIVRLTHAGELFFLFVLQGSLRLDDAAAGATDARGHHLLRGGDSCVIPAGAAYSLRAGAGLRLLAVAL
jgi:mannose-6-phosphate isomerase-like protein (cupin superfamily)